MKRKVLSILFAAVMTVMAVGSLAGCGKTKREADEIFTYWVSKVDGRTVYGDYENNPGMKYMESMEWESGGKNVNVGFEFKGPSEAINPEQSFETSISTNPYDIMELTYAKNSIMELYNSGTALDITEYVEAYMPNYRKFLADKGFESIATNIVDGEKRYLQLYNYLEVANSWLGYIYRRDWIAKYGKHPVTNVAFGAGSWDAPKKNWTDTVVFPSWFYDIDGANGLKGKDVSIATTPVSSITVASDMSNFITQYKSENSDWTGQYPVTISDWEWMLAILTNAIAGEKISTAYPMSIYNTGYNMSGSLVSSFGGGGVEWYKNENDGKVRFGATETDPSIAAYTEAMASWYKKGWIDKGFQAHQDLFYRTDEVNVWAGNVGLWAGTDSSLQNKMENSVIPATKDMCGYGMPYPINDLYGAESNKFADPYCFYQVSEEVCSIMVTKSAKDKDLVALFKLLDYNYSEEGSLLRSGGFTKQQYEETQNKHYKKAGLTDGMVAYDADAGYYKYTGKAGDMTKDQRNIYKPIRFFGYEKYVREQFVTNEQMFTENLWIKYKPTGRLDKSAEGQLTLADGKDFKNVQLDARELMKTSITDFIKGTGGKKVRNADGSYTTEWRSMVLSISQSGVNRVSTNFNKALGL